jgi:hypothetical protein
LSGNNCKVLHGQKILSKTVDTISCFYFDGVQEWCWRKDNVPLPHSGPLTCRENFVKNEARNREINLGRRSIAEVKLMKRNKLTTTAALCVAIATFTVTSASALTSIQVQEIKQAVLGVPVPEMPAKAAELVSKAEKKDKQAVAVTAVRAAMQKHRAAAPLVISAISKAAPEIAPAVAVAASELSNDQAPLLARAAAVSAPGQAAEVIAAVSQAVPAQAPSIAATVNAVRTRPSASQGTSSGGTVNLSNRPINQETGGGGNGFFPLTAPVKAETPVQIYNTPPQS